MRPKWYEVRPAFVEVLVLTLAPVALLILTL